MTQCIRDMVKQAHNHAVKIKAYNCYECDGTGEIYHGAPTTPYKCTDCNGTGKMSKHKVYWKIKEEAEEFVNSTPSDIFHKDSEQSEIADQIITLLAYCGEMGYDAEKIIQEKLDYNDKREY